MKINRLHAKLKKFQILSLILFTALLEIKCSNNEKELIDSVGYPIDLGIATDKNTLKSISEIIQTELNGIQPYFTIPEGYFKLINVDFDGYPEYLKNLKLQLIILTPENKEIAKKNIIDLFSEKQIDSICSQKHAFRITKRNCWAEPQFITVIYAPDIFSLGKYITQNAKNIRTEILNEEINIYKTEYLQGKNYQSDIYKKILNKYQAKVFVPTTFKPFANNDNDEFYSFYQEGKDHQSGIIIHFYRYKDSNDLLLNNIIAQRDTFTKKYVQSDTSLGTYMCTSTLEEYPQMIEDITINDIKCKKINSMWTVKGEFKSGPFVRYIIPLKHHNKIMAIETFVYNPNEEKARHIRIGDILAQTISF